MSSENKNIGQRENFTISCVYRVLIVGSDLYFPRTDGRDLARYFANFVQCALFNNILFVFDWRPGEIIIGVLHKYVYTGI